MGGYVANDFQWSVIIDLAAKGGAKTVSDLESVQEATDKLQKSNKIGEEQYDDLNKTIASKQKTLSKDTETVETNTKSINAQRYALYEVAAAYGVVSAALIGLGKNVTDTFAEMESGFTRVERTSGLYGAAFQPLEDELLSLARTIPVAVDELQDLAARGAQMGIAANEIDSFAETLAKFVATADTVDATTAAEAFGRISNLTGVKDWEALGSSIAQVGVNSAATDAQIIKTTENMARAAAAFGFSADEIIGLSAAFASLGVQPEAVRGVMTQFITAMDDGASGLNDNMEQVALQMNITTGEAIKLWKTDPSDFIVKLSRALTTSGDLTTSLRDMGIVGQRIKPLFAALTNDFRSNADVSTVLARALEDANQGFRERAELDRQFGPLQEDLNARLVIMANSFKELAYVVGSEFAPSLKSLIDGISAVVQGASDFVKSDFGGFISRLATTVGVLVAGYAALRSAIALSSAAMIAFKTAGTALGRGIGGALSVLISLFRRTGDSARYAATATWGFNAALRAVMRATIVGGVLVAITEWLLNTGETAIKTGEAINFLGEKLRWLVQFIPIIGAYLPMASDAGWGDGLIKWGQSMVDAEESTAGLGSTLRHIGVPASNDFNESIEQGTESLGDYGGALDSVEEKLVSVSDYANELKGVFDRAFEIRFGTQNAEDATAKLLLNLKKEADDARQKIKDLRAEIRSLQADLGVMQADISTQKYFLSVALEYGDTKRAEQITANLAKLEADLAKKKGDLSKKNSELQKTQDLASNSLEGNTEGAIRNREALLELVQTYQDQLVALANSGASQQELARESERLRAEFVKQTTQLGYNRNDIKKYENSLKDLTTIIHKVPRNVSTSMEIRGVPAARAALREFENSVKDAMKRARGSVGKGINIPATSSFNDAGFRKAERGAGLMMELANLSAQLMTASGETRRWIGRSINMLRERIRTGSYAQGGFTGQGAKYEPAGIVHRGEYVVPKEQVNQRTGLPYADALGKLVKGSPASNSYARGGYVNPSTVNVVDLSAGSIQAIARAVQPHLSIDGKMVGEAASRSYSYSNRVGAN